MEGLPKSVSDLKTKKGGGVWVGRRGKLLGFPRIKKLAILVDLDGTLVDVSGIRHLVERPNPDFDAFHRDSVNCPPKKQVVQILRLFRCLRVSVIIVSARSENYRTLTNMWLAIQAIQCDDLLMRGTRDSRRDVEVKTSMYEKLSHRYFMIAALDDRDELVQNWKLLGIPFVYHVS